MSLQRFSLYFVAIMACAVVAFPHWVPAELISMASAPLPYPGEAGRAHGHPSALRASPRRRAVRRRASSPAADGRCRNS